jgi:hypothetical protein
LFIGHPQARKGRGVSATRIRKPSSKGWQKSPEFEDESTILSVCPAMQRDKGMIEATREQNLAIVYSFS